MADDNPRTRRRGSRRRRQSSAGRLACRRSDAASAQKPSANFASSLILSGVHGGVKTMDDLTSSTSSSSATNSSICSETCGPIGQPGDGERERDVDVAAVDLDPVDEAELDEVEPQLGVDHVAERVLDVFDGGHVPLSRSHAGLCSLPRSSRSPNSRAVLRCCGDEDIATQGCRRPALSRALAAAHRRGRRSRAS